MNEPSAYEQLASEYYAQGCNRTCQAFRQGSEVIVRELVNISEYTSVVEVGAGRSFAAPLMEEAGKPLSDLLISDISSGMLEWSQEWSNKGAKLTVCPADTLPLRKRSVSLIISLLGDPYNTPSFWEEVNRVLIPGGHILFTVPAYEWTQAFREGNEAVFTMKDESQVAVPSTVLDFEAQCKLVGNAGLTLRQQRNFTKGELENNLSQKFAQLSDDDPIVNGYLFRKPSRVISLWTRR